MSDQALWDVRRLGVFFIEMEAARYIRAVGPVAWAVYTYLVHYATRASRPMRLPSLNSIGEQCGMTENEVESALRQLVRYQLLEIADERQRGRDSTIRVYRIVGMKQVVEQSGEMATPTDVEEEWAREWDEGQALRQMFDAVAQVSSYEEIDIDEAARDDIFSAVMAIRSAGGDAEQIHAAAQLYRRLVPDLPLTPRNLAATWEPLSATLSGEAS